MFYLVAILATLVVSYLLVGCFQLWAIARHGGGLDYDGVVAVLSLVLLVLIWPWVIWEHTAMACAGNSKSPDATG